MAAMGRAARREYEEKYTPNKNYPMLMSIYERAIATQQSGQGEHEPIEAQPVGSL